MSTISELQYRPRSVRKGARRMVEAGLGQYLSATERQLLADNDNERPEPKRKAVGAQHDRLHNGGHPTGLPAQYEGW